MANYTTFDLSVFMKCVPCCVIFWLYGIYTIMTGGKRYYPIIT